jgi:hypothetical protein
VLDRPEDGGEGCASDPSTGAARLEGLASARRAGQPGGVGLANPVGDLVPGHLSAQHLHTSFENLGERYVRSRAAGGDGAYEAGVTSSTLRNGLPRSKMRP